MFPGSLLCSFKGVPFSIPFSVRTSLTTGYELESSQKRIIFLPTLTVFIQIIVLKKIKLNKGEKYKLKGDGKLILLNLEFGVTLLSQKV